MRKKYLSILLAVVLGTCSLTGCQQAPEASGNGEIPHAKSNVEQAVEDVVEQGAENPDETNTADALAEQGGFYDGVIGTQDNGIWVCAEIPAVKEKISRLTLTARQDLDEDTLRAFLDSQNGKVRDVTQQYLAELEAELNAPPVEVDAGDSIEQSYTEVMTHFGDESTLVFSDGERRAAFTWNTAAYFRDEKLLGKYYGIAAGAEEKELSRGEENEDAPFTMAQAEKLLMEKLGTLGITEIDYMKVYYQEYNGEGCYEMHFTPRYEGIGMAQEFGSTKKEEVIPYATAAITEDGVAEMNLWHCLGKIGEKKDEGKVLRFSQVEDILKKYLESNMFAGCAEAKLTQAEVVYYPVYREEESALELIPSWHIYAPLEQVIEGAEAENSAYGKLLAKSAAWNIYMDAVTGELLRVE